MNITLTGATGFIGRRLIAELLDDGHAPRVLSRGGRPMGGVPALRWDPETGPPPSESLEGADAVVHLAGEPVAQRWSDEVKRKIRESRVAGTRNLVDGLARLGRRPAALICASAIGYYGDRGDEILTEASAPGGGFLPEVCVAWEREAQRAAALGVRVVLLRIGIVLGAEGGALKPMIPAFKAFVGGPVGSGRQWMSWIHQADMTGLIRHCLREPVSGAVNATAPEPARNADFAKALGSALHRPAIFPTPAFVLNTMFGEMARIILASQRVLPQAAHTSGYRFRFGELTGALRDVTGG